MRTIKPTQQTTVASSYLHSVGDELRESAELLRERVYSPKNPCLSPTILYAEALSHKTASIPGPYSFVLSCREILSIW
jgi:hypothetical protein